MNRNELVVFDDSIRFVESIMSRVEQFNTNNKNVIFIEPYGSACSLLKRGMELGFNIICLTANSGLRKVSNDILESVQLAIQIDTINECALFHFVDILKNKCMINAVIPGFEYFVPVATKLSRHLGLKGTDVADIQALRNKADMRQALSRAGLAVPKFAIVNSLSDVKKTIESINYPAICKPVDAAGSVHVQKVMNADEAIHAANRILNNNDVLWGHTLARQLLLEEYIDGDEYSIEGVITNGQIDYFSVTEKIVSDQREFIEIGHIINPPMESEIRQQIVDYITKVITVLRPNNCPFHAEIRITQNGQPVLMEIAARLAGDKIGDLINLANSVNYYDYIYAAYFGEHQPRPVLENNMAGIRFFYRPAIHQFTTLPDIDCTHDSIQEIRFYYKENQEIPGFPKPLRRLGHVIVKDNDYPRLLKTLNDIDACARFHP